MAGANGHKPKLRCALCGRQLPYVKTAKGRELHRSVIYSSRTGNRYCPPADHERCRALRRQLVKAEAQSA